MNPAAVCFLPGAGGSGDFWQPVTERLPTGWQILRFAWPGLGNEPHDPAINGMDDLVELIDRRLAKAHVTGPVDLVAQSMGGVVAARFALAMPERVRRLVLVATSAGLDMPGLGASDWRSNYRRNFPAAAAWITGNEAAAELPVQSIGAPTLLVWGDADDISPLAVGEALERRMPVARLVVIPGGDHDLAIDHADQVAAHVLEHLAS